MAKQTFSYSLLFSAGASLVDAIPHPQFGLFGSESSSFPTFSFPGFGYPSQTPSAVPFPSASGSSFAGPTGFSSPGASYGATGTGLSSSFCSVVYTTISSFPAGTGSSVAGPSSIAPSSDGQSVATFQSSDFSSLAAAASASSDPTSSVGAIPLASASSDPATSASITASSGCTFTDADAAMASKGSCSAIVINGITVPAGKTLDLTDLNDGTTVSLELIHSQDVLS